MSPLHSFFIYQLGIYLRLVSLKEEPKPELKHKKTQSAQAVEMILHDTNRPMTTTEIAQLLHEIGCPDSPSRLLNRLRQEGRIHGKLSIKRKTWFWWAPGVTEPLDT